MSDGKVYRPRADTARDPSSFRLMNSSMFSVLGGGRRAPPRTENRKLYASPLRRAAAVVGDGGRVADGRDPNARGVDGADGRLAAAARPLDVYLGLLHPDLLGL